MLALRICTRMCYMIAQIIPGTSGAERAEEEPAAYQPCIVRPPGGQPVIHPL
jgi:hypothetical protein